MKRSVPLFITTTVGFVLIVAYFIPATQWLGEFAAISFDILAAIAFVLGGGNLLKTHLKKISDRKAGWGYSGITIAAFLVMMVIGLGKIGVPPAVDQEYYGETFAPLSLSDFPDSQVARVPGAIPTKTDGSRPAPSVRQQIGTNADNGTVSFRGWMRANQQQDLLNFQDELQWQCTVENLFESAQPSELLRGKVAYYADLGMLSFRGPMQDDERAALLAMSDRVTWQTAVESIYERSRAIASVALEQLPEGVTIPSSLADIVAYDAAAQRLQVTGPLSLPQRDTLARQFQIVKPSSESSLDAFRQEIEGAGSPLNEAQVATLQSSLETTWSVAQLSAALNAAGKAREVPKTACEMLAEMQSGNVDIEATKIVGTDVSLSSDQEALLAQFASDENMSVFQLAEQLAAAGTFTPSQHAALETFFANVPTVGDRNKELCLALFQAGPLNRQQRQLLFAAKLNELAWRRKVTELFQQAHVTKYSWSGDYGVQGSAFWWMYEHVFKPLTATMFSMLAFYVASAAFRAFRAKNIEAILLLGTAFIVLLGRTFAGVWLTSWMPASLEGLRIENLTVFIMSVFTTAGNRAIMIGIALGIAATSLKILLGIDRSYLGQEED